MKTRLFVIALMVVVAGFGACKKPGPDPVKSSDNQITKFEVSGVSYDINQSTGDITKIYDKVPAGGAWNGLPAAKVKPTITYAAKATIDPVDAELDFTKLPAGEGSGTLQTYTVTAEDGKTKKTYTVKVTKGGLK